MNQIRCSYHPTAPAQWECLDCNLHFCGQCVMKRETVVYGMVRVHHLCPKCNQNAQGLAVANIIEPFWTRLNKIFAYPFRYQPLAFIIMVAFIDAVISTLFGPIPMMKLLVFLFWGGLIKFSFAVLRETSYGNFKPPEITPETITEGWGLVIKQMLIVGLLVIAGMYVFPSAGVELGILFVFLAILLYPAMTIVLVVTESLFDALNPLIFARMAWRLGRGYLLMYVFLILLAGAPSVLRQYAMDYLPFFFQQFLVTMAEGYYTVVMYHLMGYVLLQYHDKVGWEVELQEYLDSGQPAVGRKLTGNPLLDQLDLMIRDGQIDEAIAHVKEQTQGHITEVALAERYYKLLRMKQLVPDMLDHGKAYMNMLIEAGDERALCEVYAECTAASPEFLPTAATLLKTAGVLNRNGKYREAVSAYNRFVKANPTDPRVPKAYFQAANILNERLNAPQKARQVIMAIIKRYPKHEVAPHAQDYLARIAV